jgi:hypothetical protein
MKLEKDVFSSCNPKRKYGEQGEVVGVVSYHGSVAIVENLLGEKFAVKAELLSGTVAEKTTEPIIEKPKQSTKTVKANKPAPIIQPSLF